MAPDFFVAMTSWLSYGVGFDTCSITPNFVSLSSSFFRAGLWLTLTRLLAMTTGCESSLRRSVCLPASFPSCLSNTSGNSSTLMLATLSKFSSCMVSSPIWWLAVKPSMDWQSSSLHMRNSTLYFLLVFGFVTERPAFSCWYCGCVVPHFQRTSEWLQVFRIFQWEHVA